MSDTEAAARELKCNIRTGDDASKLIIFLPNAHRGIAAKRLYEHRGIVGNGVAYRGLIEAWDHDHRWVLSAFGSCAAFAAALREVNPARKAKTSIIAWRGTDSIDAAYGLSWTTNRATACWFAIRSPRNTPFVFRCELSPDDIVARYNGRNEQEIIVDPQQMTYVCVSVDDGYEEGFETYACDIASPDDVPPAAIADWRKGAERYAAFIKAHTERRLLRKARGSK